MGRAIESNNVTISGVITGNFQYSYEFYGEKFYVSTVASKRGSGIMDYVPITVSERLVDVSAAWSGQNVKIFGTFRSYNRHTDSGNHVVLSVFVDEIACVGKVKHGINLIHLDGYICKLPVYRKTPLCREIADVLLAVNRPFGKSDYIPCVFWGRNAQFASGLTVGTRLLIDGRIQSREYTKKYENGELETRTAYEVSVGSIKVADESEGLQND